MPDIALAELSSLSCIQIVNVFKNLKLFPANVLSNLAHNRIDGAKLANILPINPAENLFGFIPEEWDTSLKAKLFLFLALFKKLLVPIKLLEETISYSDMVLNQEAHLPFQYVPGASYKSEVRTN